MVDSLHVQVAPDGGTVGRFSKRWGLDVHTTATAQLGGASQCLHCTHEPAGRDQWLEFCALMAEHHGIEVDPAELHFEEDENRDRPNCR